MVSLTPHFSDLDPRDARRRMIRETSVFLSWALGAADLFPDIPARAVRDGGFDALLNPQGGERLALVWWETVLSTGCWE